MSRTRDGRRPGAWSLPFLVTYGRSRPNASGQSPRRFTFLNSGQKDRVRRVKRQNDRLDEFTSVVSLYLQNPLTVGRGRIGLHDRGRVSYVGNDGPGVPAGDRDAIFEHGRTTSDEGPGFGLSIVERSECGGARFEVAGVDVGR